MGAVKDYRAQILPIIKGLREDGQSDAHILQMFELALDESPNSEIEPEATIAVKVYEDRVDADAEGSSSAILRGISGMIIGYGRAVNQSVGDSIAEILIELSALSDVIDRRAK